MGKNCRHVRQALHLSEFRRALKARAAFACEGCATPNASGNHRVTGGVANGGGSNSSRGGTPIVLPSPGVAGELSPPGELLSPLQTWESRAHWDDLCVCVTCGFIGCFGGGHMSKHFQLNSKHFVAFQAGSKTFWCSACKMEITDGNAKVEENRLQCETVFEDMVTKRVRQLKNQVPLATPTSTGRGSAGTPRSGDADESRGGNDKRDGDDAGSEHGSSRGNTSKGVASGDLPSQRPVVDDSTPVTITSPPRGNVAELLNMPMRSKSRDERARRRMMKGTMPARDLTPKEPDVQVAEVATTTPGSPTTVLGFTNLGNTCYFNASIQALLTATHFFPEYTHIRETLEMADVPVLNTFTMLHETVKKRARRALSEVTKEENGKQEPVTRRHASGRSRSKSSSVLTVAPLLKEIRKKFAQFRGDYQQDAHELFTSLLWAIDEETDPPTPVARKDSVDSNPASSTTTANTEDDDDGSESGEEGTRQLFVKTETGDTISMQVPKSATMDEVQKLLAKRLNLNEEDMMLSGSRESVRASMPRESRVGKAHSKLNLARNLFGGALTTAVTCQSCGNHTETLEDAFIVSMSIPESSRGRSLSVIDCFQGFVRETHLLVSAKNGYDCDRCSRQPKKQTRAGPFGRKKHHGGETEIVLRDATMRAFISELPRVLAIHLKRLGRAKKITDHVAFDPVLDVLPFVSEKLQKLCNYTSPRYELIAVVVHMGGKRGGHYVAYVSRSRRRESGSRKSRQPQDSDDEPSTTQSDRQQTGGRTWYYISDTVVKRVEFEQVLKCEAYMLFYQQIPLP